MVDDISMLKIPNGLFERIIMGLVNKKQLRKCQAWVYENDSNINVLAKREGGFFYASIEHAYVLESYSSIVAIYDIDDKCLYKLPRSSYSVTTKQQVNKFIKDYDVIGFCPVDVDNFSLDGTNMHSWDKNKAGM